MFRGSITQDVNKKKKNLQLAPPEGEGSRSLRRSGFEKKIPSEGSYYNDDLISDEVRLGLNGIAPTKKQI